ncbi:MAG: zinc-ribbon domain-containing protein [Candidatus Freyarchaeota archaeon]|nr:zinc-ribbon domain-containing protein [Candidatus Jordarchaeia archaeon]
MRCPNCNAEISPDEVKCPSCGAKIGEEIIERLLPILKRPLEEPASPLPIYYKFLTSIIKPSIVFGNIAISPDPIAPFVMVLLNAILSTVYFSFVLNNVFFMDTLSLLIFRAMFAPLSIELFYFNFLFTLLELILISFLYWLPFKLLGRGSSFKSFFSMAGYAYILVVIGQIFSIIVSSGNVTLIPEMPLLLQLLVFQFRLYSVWIFGRAVKLVCLLGMAFLLTPGIRKLTKLSTGLSLASSYAIIFIAIFFLAKI